MTTDNFCFYLQNRLIQTGPTGGQWYIDTSAFSIPWYRPHYFKWWLLLKETILVIGWERMLSLHLFERGWDRGGTA
jgi:hypothetical protein